MEGDFLIGVWLVQPTRNTITSEATSIHLEPKVMDVLVYLAKHTDEQWHRQPALLFPKTLALYRNTLRAFHPFSNRPLMRCLRRTFQIICLQ